MTLVAFLIGLPMLKSEVAFNAVASISVIGAPCAVLSAYWFSFIQYACWLTRHPKVVVHARAIVRQQCMHAHWHSARSRQCTTYAAVRCCSFHPGP